jgi:hypothetical protein
MKQQQEPLATLHEIRNIMDRSSRFISLSGLSGVTAGISSLIGAAVVKGYLVTHHINYRQNLGLHLTGESCIFMILVAALVFILALCSATYFTARKARKSNHRVWDPQRL